MLVVLQNLFPIFLAFGVAFLAKKLGIMEAKDGSRLLKLALTITMPALTFMAVSQIEFTRGLLVFPLLPVIAMAATFVVARVVLGYIGLKHPQKGLILTAPMIANTAFVLPFLLATFAEQGVARVVLFNVGNSLFLFTWVYALAATSGNKALSRSELAQKLLSLPPLWGLVLGIIANVTNFRLPEFAADAVSGIGNLTGLLVVLALGLLFNPVRRHAKTALTITGIRMITGLAVGLAVASAFHLTGLDRAAAVALAAAPVGFNAIMFASAEKLDDELAASAVSYSVMAAMVLMPLIMWFLV